MAKEFNVICSPKAGRQDQPEVAEKIFDRSTIYANHVVGQLLMAMNKNQFNLFSSVQLGPAGADKKNHLIFKPSTVRFDNTMCVHLSGN